MPTLHSHTHWQAPQADTQAQACQRVCLSHAEKKKLKITFPCKILKTLTHNPTQKHSDRQLQNSIRTRVSATDDKNASL